MKRRDLMLLLGGAAFAAPFAARAQKKPTPVVGELASARFVGSHFEEGLGEAGYVDGQNARIVYRWALGQYDQLPAMAADLVRRRVDVIAAFGLPAVLAAKRATATIPIVFVSGDPIAEGLASSLARPGGNLTGISIIDVDLLPKRLDLLSELVPRVKVFALLVNPNNPDVAPEIRRARLAAHAKGVELHILKAASIDEIDAAFASFARLRAGGLVVEPDPFFGENHSYIINLASRHRVAAIFGWSDFAWEGGVMSYGPSLPAVERRLGIYAGKILKGAKPADLPIEQPAKFELAINLRVAKALGIRVPPWLLARADEVIR
jgi:putative ABC transport system substrate-binding protein